MGSSMMKVSGDREYISSDRWKCAKSPSGAHHWIIQNYQMTCRYCNDVKQAGTTNPGLPAPETK
jgi:hypothetical protein